MLKRTTVPVRAVAWAR
jgi:hypothetical protein